MSKNVPKISLAWPFLGIGNQYILAKNSNVLSVNIRQSGKKAQLFTTNLHMVQSVNIRQLSKGALLGIINLYIWAKSLNVQSVYIRQFIKVTLSGMINLYT